MLDYEEIGMVDAMSKHAFVPQIGGMLGKATGKVLGTTAKFVKNNPGTALTAAFAAPGAVEAGRKVTRSMSNSTTKYNPLRKNLLEPVTSKSPMGSIF